MSPVQEKARVWPRLRGARELVLAATAVGAVAIAMSQPAVMSMAGLDFKRTRAGGVDGMPVGTIARQSHVHGLTGIIKPMRMRD